MHRGTLSFVQKLILGALMLNIGAYGCVTSWMWSHHSERKPRHVKRQDVSAPRVEIVTLPDNRIAVYASGGQGALDNVATVYDCHGPMLEAIKRDDSKLFIREEITYQGTKFHWDIPPEFRIETPGNWRYYVQFLGVILAKRSDSLVLENKRVSFKRVVWGDKIPKDFSWLWKLPATPLTIVFDVVSFPFGLAVLAYVIAAGHGF